MYLSLVLLILGAAWATSVLGYLPPTGVPLVIVNVQTGGFIDDIKDIETVGNPIITFPFLNMGNQKWILDSKAPDQVPPDDEKWTTPSNKTRGAHQKYTLTCLKPVISVFSNGTHGDGLIVGECPSVFTITDLGDDGLTEIYRISQGHFTVTSVDAREGQLTLQTLNETSRLQQWRIFEAAVVEPL